MSQACSFSVRSLFLNDYVISLLLGERPFKCNVPGCDRSFTTSNIRKVHVRTHTGERPYECTEPGCGRAFASATNFKNHMRIHSGEKPYICTVKVKILGALKFSNFIRVFIANTFFFLYSVCKGNKFVFPLSSVDVWQKVYRIFIIIQASDCSHSTETV